MHRRVGLITGLLGLLIAAPWGCVPDGGDGRLAQPISGRGAPRDGVPRPHLTGVVQVQNNVSACTGTLITPNLVLTAAHCFGAGGGDPACWIERADGSVQASGGCGTVRFTHTDGVVRDQINIRHVWLNWSAASQAPVDDMALVLLERKASPATAARATPTPVWTQGDPGAAHWSSARIEYAGWGFTDLIADTCDGIQSASRRATELGVELQKRLDGRQPLVDRTIGGRHVGGPMFSATFDLYGDSTGLVLKGDSGGPLFADQPGAGLRVVGVAALVTCQDLEVSGTLQSLWSRTLHGNNAGMLRRVMLGAGQDPDGDGTPSAGPGLNPWMPAEADNCPNVYNPDQVDSDSDGSGDACPPIVTGLMLDTNGTLDVSWFDPLDGGGWHPPQPISLRGVAPAGATVAMAQQSPSVLTALLADVNGALDVAWLDVTDGRGWHPPQPISARGLTRPGGAVAMERQSESVTTALLIDNDGALRVAWLDLLDGRGWHAPIPISGSGLAPAGGAVALARQTPTVLTALLVDNNGALRVAWFDALDGHGWHAPIPISGNGLAPAGAAVAMAKQTDTVLTALLVDSNGALRVSWLDLLDGHGWHAPIPISGGGLAPAGGAVAMAKQTATVLAALLVDNNGALRVSWLDLLDGRGWHAPIPISGSGLAPAGASVAMVKQTAATTTAILSDHLGRLQLTWLDLNDGRGWHAPIPISVPGTLRPGGGVALFRQPR